MSETKFTKGKWEAIGVDGGYAVLRRDTGYGICKTVLKESADLANAHLIAAAPEMYEMLERCKKAMFKDGFDVEDIENLLAKARGENA